MSCGLAWSRCGPRRVHIGRNWCKSATRAADSQGHDWTPIYSVSRTTHRNCAIFGLGAKEQRRCRSSAVPLHHKASHGRYVMTQVIALSLRKRGAFIDPHGYDAGKKIKGKKRHILVDTLGLLLHAIVHPADIQDRDGCVLVMATLFGMFPFLKTLFADSGYQGPKFAKALAKVLPHLNIEIVKRSDQASGFVVLPKRWIVERIIAWLNRCRRLAKDWENLNRKALAFLRLASIRLMLRKLCNPA